MYTVYDSAFLEEIPAVGCATEHLILNASFLIWTYGQVVFLKYVVMCTSYNFTSFCPLLTIFSIIGTTELALSIVDKIEKINTKYLINFVVHIDLFK